MILGSKGYIKENMGKGNMILEVMKAYSLVIQLILRHADAIIWDLRRFFRVNIAKLMRDFI